MHKKLTWNAVGLYQKVELLLEKIKINQGELPKENLTDFRKHQRFVDTLMNLKLKMDKIMDELIPSLEKVLRLRFKTPELIFFNSDSKRSICPRGECR